MGLRKRQIVEVEIDGSDLDPVFAAHQIQDMLHKKAAEALNRETMQNLTEWINQRFVDLRIGLDDIVRLTLKPKNLEGFGFQSVVMATINGDKPVRLQNEIEDPQIIVVANGLVDSSVLPFVYNFSISEGQRQVVSVFRPTHLDLTNESDNFTGSPQIHPVNKPLTVSKPFSLRTIIERDIIHTGLDPKAIRRKAINHQGAFVISTESAT